MTNSTNTLEFKAYRDMDKKDGIDHIRIDKHAITLLGKQLIPSYTRTFYHPVYGSFASIQSAIEWYKLEKDDFDVRLMTGTKLDEYVKEQIESGKNTVKTTEVPDYVIKEFITYSLLSKPDLFSMAVENKLPYCCYHVGNDGYAKVNYIQYTRILGKVIGELRGK